MKDPLATKETAYDVLGLDRSADATHIDAAFKAGLMKKVKVQKLMGARKTLENPLKRALLDLFNYDSEALGALQPHPLAEPEALDLANRAETARAWEALHEERFPHHGINHSLAVLWYWWATHESDLLLESGGTDAGAIEKVKELWEGAIACWCMIQADGTFWQGQDSIPADVRDEVRSSLLKRLTDDLKEFAQKQRDAGSEDLAAFFAALELALDAELKTAQTVARAELMTEQGTLACGRLMLSRFGALETLRSEITEALSQSPDDEALHELALALSPHANIAALLERNQFQDALDEIGALPAKERRSEEVLGLKAEALFEAGRQQESLGHTDEALSLWKKALDCKPALKAAAQIRETAESACIGRAGQLQKKKRGQAIKLLEKALKFLESRQVEETLAELLTVRAIETINKAQERAEKEDPKDFDKLLKALKRGENDLARAADLGSARAKDQLKQARELVGQIQTIVDHGGAAAVAPGVDMPSSVRELLGKAHAAADAENLVLAVANLRTALKEVDAKSEAGTLVRKNLSAALVGLSVQLANQAVEKVNRLYRSYDDILDARELAEEAGKVLVEAGNVDPQNESAGRNMAQVLDLMDELKTMRSRRMAGKPMEYRELMGLGRNDRAFEYTMFVLVLLIGPFLTGLLALPGPKWILDGPANWIDSIAVGSSVGMVALWLCYLAGFGTWAFMIIGHLTGRKTFDNFFQKKWSSKRPLTKVMEGALYAFYPAFVAGIFLRTDPPPVVEVPRDEVVLEEVAGEAGMPEEAGEAATGSDPAPARETGVTPAEDELDIPAAEPEPPAAEPETHAAEPPSDLLGPPTVPAPVEVDFTDLSWTTAAAVTPDFVTVWLEALTGMDPPGAASVGQALSMASSDATPEGRAVASLLIGWAAELSGDEAGAQVAYHGLLASAGDSPYGHAAQLRLDLLDASEEGEVDAVYESLAETGGVELWVLLDGGWQWGFASQLGLLGLMEARSGQWFTRLANGIRRWSPFPEAYHWFFIVLVLSALLTLLKFPLLNQIGKILAEAQNPRRAKKEIDPLPGCFSLMVGTGLAVCFFFLMRSYSPQMELDQARFLWTESVLERNFWVHAGWVFLGTFFMGRIPLDIKSGGYYLTRSFFWCSAIAVITWLWGWPVWAMVFWLILLTMSTMVYVVTGATHAMRG